jgi:hypothetical protein
MARSTRTPAQEIVERYAPRLKYPYLFIAVVVLFVADLFFPDPIPFVDEVMLALLTFILGSWRSRRKAPPDAVEVSASTPEPSKTSPDE